MNKIGKFKANRFQSKAQLYFACCDFDEKSSVFRMVKQFFSQKRFSKLSNLSKIKLYFDSLEQFSAAFFGSDFFCHGAKHEHTQILLNFDIFLKLFRSP